jgi:hypothetical protein
MTFHPAGWVAVLLLLGTGSVPAQANDMFPTKEGAAVPARQLPCKGLFAMGEQWMPCSDFSAYEKALAKTK